MVGDTIKQVENDIEGKKSKAWTMKVPGGRCHGKLKAIEGKDHYLCCKERSGEREAVGRCVPACGSGSCAIPRAMTTVSALAPDSCEPCCFHWDAQIGARDG